MPRTETPDAPMPPIKVCAMNTAAGSGGYEKRTSPYGQPYYWAAGSGMEFMHTHPDSDVDALMNRCLTVTPLEFDLTDHPRVQTWRERLED